MGRTVPCEAGEGPAGDGGGEIPGVPGSCAKPRRVLSYSSLPIAL